MFRLPERVELSLPRKLGERKRDQYIYLKGGRKNYGNRHFTMSVTYKFEIKMFTKNLYNKLLCHFFI